MKQVILLTTNRFIDTLYSYSVFKSVLEKDYDNVVLYHYDNDRGIEAAINYIERCIEVFNGKTEILSILEYSVSDNYDTGVVLYSEQRSIFTKIIKSIKNKNKDIKDYQYEEDDTFLNNSIRVYQVLSNARDRDIWLHSKTFDVFKELESIHKLLYSFYRDQVYSDYGHVENYKFSKNTGTIDCILNGTDYIVFNTLYRLETCVDEINLINYHRVIDEVTLALFDDLTTLMADAKQYLHKFSIKLRLCLFMSWTSTYYEYWPDLGDNHIVTIGRSKLSKCEIVDYFRYLNIANNFLVTLIGEAPTFINNRVNTIIDYRNINLGHLHIYSFGTFSTERIVRYLQTVNIHNSKWKIYIEPMGDGKLYGTCICHKVKFGLKDEDGNFKPLNKKQVLELVRCYTWRENYVEI